MKQEPKVAITVDENKIYKVTTTIDEDGLKDLLISHRNGMKVNYNFYFEKEVTELFAQEYVKRNFDSIANLIDLETVKMLATRQLAKIVSKNAET